MKVYNVLEIYRITLLSNPAARIASNSAVLEIYRITLLSNQSPQQIQKKKRFRDLQNYTTLKHLQPIASFTKCFRDLQNYTTLKRCPL